MFPIYRHGEPPANYMRTQIVEKGPKWSFAARRPETSRTDDTPIPGCAPRDEGRFKYRKSPSYTFGGRPESKARPRPSSAPPGGRRDRQQGQESVPRSMTRQNSYGTNQRSFGTSTRKLPWGGSGPDLGPGPTYTASTMGLSGCRYSLGGKLETKPSSSQSELGPGPAAYNPGSRRGSIKGGPRYQRSHSRPSSAGSRASIGASDHPGPMYNPKLLGRGPSFSIGYRIDRKEAMREADEGAFRPLPPPFTHFGYDDFGRSMGID